LCVDTEQAPHTQIELQQTLTTGTILCLEIS